MQVAELFDGEENVVYADAGYIGVEKCEEYESREVICRSQRAVALIPS